MRRSRGGTGKSRFGRAGALYGWNREAGAACLVTRELTSARREASSRTAALAGEGAAVADRSRTGDRPEWNQGRCMSGSRPPSVRRPVRLWREVWPPAIQLHQPTGAEVPSSPHRPRSTKTAATQPPKGIKAAAISAIRAGMTIRVRYRFGPRKRPISKVPAKPVAPSTSSTREIVVTSIRVTVSRNGRI